MKIKEFQHQPVKPDTYEASMALNQLMRIGKHAIKLHNMIDDATEMESWVAKKIDLAGDYVKKVYNYTEGEKAGLYDDGGMTEIKKMPKGTGTMYGEDAGDIGNEIAKMYDTAYEYINDSSDNPSDIESDYKFGYNDDDSMEAEDLAAAFRKDLKTGMALQKQLQAQREKEGREGDWDPFNPESMYHNELKALMSKAKGESVSEDAGEGHMSKSTLYHTAKYAIALMDMIKPGDDLEGWVQSKLNKAADYLQGVYNYEEYQKLNPYREELDASLMQKHAQVVQKNIDEILAKETKLDDIDTKPGMMRILAKRVNEVEKEIAKETRKKTDESGILYRAGVKKYGKAGMKAIQSAAGKGASHQEIGKIKDKHLKDAEDLEEGLKDWARNLAAAGVIVGAVAGLGSIQNAIDNTVPAVKAMNTAYEMAIDAGNDELAKNIKNDISAVKVRLDSGKDLNFVKAMQEKYAKFIQTEGLAYESRLQVQLNQQLK